jgi:hypothetical protein
MLGAHHVAFHMPSFLLGGFVGFVVGAVATAFYAMHKICEWWKASIHRGFALLAHVNGERPVRGEDIRLAFDPDVREERDRVLASIDDDGPEAAW